MSNSANLADVLRHPGIWRRSAAERKIPAHPTGFAPLDAVLPGGGWPLGALSEVISEFDGLGELGLIAPALAALTRSGRRIALIAPPYVPYAPALAAAGIDLAALAVIDAKPADMPWATEQCLRAGCCGAVLGWLQHADYKQLRRLQLAAETGGGLAFLLRPARVAAQSSPAALRLLVARNREGSSIEVLKCRGRFDSGRLAPMPLRA